MTETKSDISFAETGEKNSNEGEITVGKSPSDQVDKAVLSKKTTSLPCKNIAKSELKKFEQKEPGENLTSNLQKEEKLLEEKFSNKKSNTLIESTNPEDGKNQNRNTDLFNEEPVSAEAEAKDNEGDFLKKLEDGPDASSILTETNSIKNKKLRKISQLKRSSEIPKLKPIQKTSPGSLQKPHNALNKLSVNGPERETGKKLSEETADTLKIRTDSQKIILTSKTKRSDSVQQALSEDFGYIVPLYEEEFRKISDVWVNTIYCSLTMRTNLVKLLFQASPHINREQFHTEDDRLLHCIAHAKSFTKSEAENLKKVIKALVANRDKTKEDYTVLTENKEIAEVYNNDWKKIIRKVTELGEETKRIQMETPKLQKKRETSELTMNEKIRRMEYNLYKKEDEIKKLVNQINILKQKEFAYKENALFKVPDYKEIKADVHSLISTQKEYEELKAKYLYQNFTFEKKIKDLEDSLEEKKKILEKERDVKKQLQTLLYQLQVHHKRLTSLVGTEQIDYVMGRSYQDRSKRRQQLWIAAVKLVLRGFLVQMKKLERDRNKMLLALQTHDPENSVDITTIIQKNNFIKSIQEQMNDIRQTYSL